MIKHQEKDGKTSHGNTNLDKMMKHQHDSKISDKMIKHQHDNKISDKMIKHQNMDDKTSHLTMISKIKVG